MGEDEPKAERRARFEAALQRASRTTEPLFNRLGGRRIEQMRSFLFGLVGLYEPHLPADIDAVLALIPKEHWTLAVIAENDKHERVRELARIVDDAWKRSRGV